MNSVIKMNELYNAIYGLIDWNDKSIGDEIADCDAMIAAQISRTENMRSKFRKLMNLIVGTVSSGFMDFNSYYIDSINAPVIAAL